MNEKIDDVIMDKLKKVCLCKGISVATVKRAILEGAQTVEEVKEATGAAKGGCNGYRCIPKIEEMLKDSKKKKNSL